jgi:hypothetical protein
MNEYVYFDDLAARVFDLGDDRTEISIEVAAPSVAGEVSLDLGHGVIVRADYVEPQNLLGIDVEFTRSNAADAPSLPLEVIQLLESLIGSQCAAEIEAIVGRISEELIPIRGHGAPVPSAQNDPLRNTSALELGNAMHLLSIANDSDELLGVRVVAAFEAMSSRWFPRDPTMGRIVLERVMEVLEEIRELDAQGPTITDDLAGDIQALPTIDEKIAMMTLDLVEHERFELPSQLRALRKRVHDLLQERMSEVWRNRRVTNEPSEVDRESKTVRVDFETPVTAEGIQEISPGRLIATWVDEPQGNSIRILDRRDGSILSVAPIRESESGWFAEAVFPADLKMAELDVSPTDRPFPISQSSSIDRVFEAIDLGRQAMNLTVQRMWRSVDVRSAWEACAHAWESLGDQQRADQARKYISGGPPKRDAFTVDWVRARLEAEQIH